MKFENSMKVKAVKLLDSQRLKGFEVGKTYRCFVVNRHDSDVHRGGIYIKDSSDRYAIRLQDLGGNVTGHGTFFEPVVAKEKKAEQAENETEENYN